MDLDDEAGRDIGPPRRRDHRLGGDLIGIAGIDQAGRDRPLRAHAVAGGRRAAIGELDERRQPAEKIGQAEIPDIGLEIGNAVLQRGAVDEEVRAVVALQAGIAVVVNVVVRVGTSANW
jgi:hypothetical protein